MGRDLIGSPFDLGATVSRWPYPRRCSRTEIATLPARWQTLRYTGGLSVQSHWGELSEQMELMTHFAK
jgi:hypothetical protein